MLADISQNAAIHIEDVAVNEIGSIGCQEHRGANQVLGLAPAGSGGLGDDELIEGMTAAIGLRHAQGRGLRSLDVAGVGKALGQSIREFKKEVGSDKKDETTEDGKDA